MQRGHTRKLEVDLAAALEKGDELRKGVADLATALALEQEGSRSRESWIEALEQDQLRAQDEARACTAALVAETAAAREEACVRAEQLQRAQQHSSSLAQQLELMEVGD